MILSLLQAHGRGDFLILKQWPSEVFSLTLSSHFNAHICSQDNLCRTESPRTSHTRSTCSSYSLGKTPAVQHIIPTLATFSLFF